jgi:molybdopterin-guanine dinucleotide biosynthesis protein A
MPGGTLGVVLAGGRGSRWGGLDKGLQRWRDTPLVDAVLQRLTPQVDALVISANRNTSVYAQRGWPVLQDADPLGFEGPLAGVLAAMQHAEQHGLEWLQLSACDTPLLPLDLRARLQAACADCDAAYPLPPSGPEPAHALLHVRVRPRLVEAMAQGERRLLGFMRSLPAATVPWPDAEQAFANLNTPAAGQDLC